MTMAFASLALPRVVLQILNSCGRHDVARGATIALRAEPGASIRWKQITELGARYLPPPSAFVTQKDSDPETGWHREWRHEQRSHHREDTS